MPETFYVSLFGNLSCRLYTIIYCNLDLNSKKPIVRHFCFGMFRTRSNMFQKLEGNGRQRE